jgi:hypothetical protein
VFIFGFAPASRSVSFGGASAFLLTLDGILKEDAVAVLMERLQIDDVGKALFELTNALEIEYHRSRGDFAKAIAARKKRM